VIVADVIITSETDRWVVLTLYKSTIIVLSRDQMIEGIKRGKAWRRAAAMRARLAVHDREAIEFKGLRDDGEAT
jgi:hypothetical protein